MGIDEETRRLATGDLQRLEVETVAKRRAWFESRGQRTRGRPSPRDAYDLFLIEYLGLPVDQVPVESETDDQITWRSTNDCPTLAACDGLGLDTRHVCRSVYEKPTQALISRLDPELRFWRSYEEIRPHSPACREGIVRVDFERLMRLAIERARASRASGNKGYGAAVALPDRVLSVAHDTATTQRDPSLHAEVNVIRQAIVELGDPNLCGAMLVSTCEPCPMCSSLAVWANVTTVVYGVSIERTAQLGKARIRVSCEDLVGHAPGWTEVIGGVLEDECLSLYQ